MSTDALKPFQYHGVDFYDIPKPDKIKESDKPQAIGNCSFPSCPQPQKGGKGKFFVNCKTGLYHCKHCGKEGNTITFLSEYFEEWRAKTTKEHYTQFETDRPGITVAEAKAEGLAYCDDRGLWLLPVRNRHGSVINIGVWKPGMVIQYTAGVPLAPFGMDQLKSSGPVYILEGPSDWLAFKRLIRLLKEKGSVIAATSANVFKSEWIQDLQGRECHFLYDNDAAGHSGMETATIKLQGKASLTSRIRWPTGIPDGWDMRDFIHQSLDIEQLKPDDVWGNIMEMLHEDEPALDGDAIKQASFNPDDYPKRKNITAVCTDFKKAYHFDDNLRDALEVNFAVTLSVQLHGDPLWVFDVGPPGYGKTLLIRAFEQSPYAIFRSKITPRELVSGYAANGTDPSLIPQLTGKVLFLKEYTEILQMAQEAQEEMYSILRGAYDGIVDRTYGNGLRRYYPNCHFAMVAGVTDVIHGDDRASLGERFLKFQVVEGSTYEQDAHIRKALTGAGAQLTVDDMIRKIVAGYTVKNRVEYKTLVELGARPESDDLTLIPEPPAWVVDRLIALSQLVGGFRARAPVTAKGDLLYRPTVEVGTRVAKQLLKLGQCLAVVKSCKGNHIDKECWRIMLKTAFSTARGWSLDVVHALMDHGQGKSKCLTKHAIDEAILIPASTTARRMSEMEMLGVIERDKSTVYLSGKGSGMPGQPAIRWKPSDKTRHFWDIAINGKKMSSTKTAPTRKRKRA